MKFGETLNAQMQWDWRSQYLQYEVAKEMLAHYKENLPSQDDEHPGDFAIAICQFESAFFEFATRELKKINTFFLEKLNEARRKFDSLKYELDECLKYENARKKSGRKTLFKLPRKSKNIHDFKMAFSEFYYSVILLQNYQQLNLTAFRKMLKKHDKILATADGGRWRERIVLKTEFATTKAVAELESEVEQVVTEKLENNDHKRAMKMLRVAPVGHRRDSPWAIFRIGIWCGFLLLLTFVTICLMTWFNCPPGQRGCWRRSDFARNETGDGLAEDSDTFWVITLRLYRSVFLIAMLLILFGINIYGWRVAGINHALLFEFDLRDTASALGLVEVGLIILVTAFGSVIIWLLQFYVSFTLKIPLLALRLVSVSYLSILVLILVNPLPILMCKTRFWLLKCLVRIATAPFQVLHLADYFVAEQLISIVPVFQDYAFVGCSAGFGFDVLKSRLVCNSNHLFVSYNLLGCLPYFFRFAQCLRAFYDSNYIKHPHLTNAVKYSLVIVFAIFRAASPFWGSSVSTPTTSSSSDPFIVVAPSFNPFHIVAILLAVVTMIFWYLWDTKEDWRLFTERGGTIRYLRDQMAFRHTWYYYGVIGVNFVLLAIYWAMQVFDVRLTSSRHSITSEVIVTIVATGEVLRRFLWNFFRLECEHIYHPVKLNASHSVVHHYNMKPLINEEIKKVDRMMTEIDGVNAIRQERRTSYSFVC